MSTDKRAIATDDPLERLRAAVREYRDRTGVSARALDKKAGFSIGYIGNILEGKNLSPGVDRVAKIADMIGVSLADIMPDTHNGSAPVLSAMVTNRQPIMPQGNAPVVPLYAVKTVLDELFLPLIAEPVGLVPTLPALSMITGAYAFTVPNDLNAPRYMAGETIYVSPVAVPKAGDFIFARLRDGRAAIAQLIRISDSRVVTRVLNGSGKTAGDKARSREDFESIHRIVGAVG